VCAPESDIPHECFSEGAESRNPLADVIAVSMKSDNIPIYLMRLGVSFPTGWFGSAAVDR
jgi:hypothetical protein